MALYHMNAATGEPGQCSARAGHCPFGSDDVHFTSVEAARKSFEKAQETFPRRWSSQSTKVDISELMVRSAALDPDRRYSKDLDEEPIGSILIRVHHESDDRTYLAKAEDGKWYSITRASSDYALSRTPATDSVLESSGSSGYYFAKPSETFQTKLAVLVGEKKKAVIEKIATHVHKTLKYDNFSLTDVRVPRGFGPDLDAVESYTQLPYYELPTNWKENYEKLAEIVVDSLGQVKGYGGTEEVHTPTKVFEELADYYDDDLGESFTASSTRSSLNQTLKTAIWVINSSS